MVGLLTATALVAGCGDEKQTATGEEDGYLADFPYYDTVAEVTGAADIIITGKVVAVETRDINMNAGPDRETNPYLEKCVVSSIEVKRIIKGDVKKGDIVQVKQMVALVDQQESRAKAKNGVGIFFLKTYPYGIPSSLINPEQGMLAIENGQVTPHAANVLFGKAKTESEVVGEIEAAIN